MRRTEPVNKYLLSGPLSLVPKDSPQFAYQMIERWKSCWRRREYAVEDLAKVKEEIDRTAPWNHWPEQAPVRDRDAFYREYLGVDRDAAILDEIARVLSERQG